MNSGLRKAGYEDPDQYRSGNRQARGGVCAIGVRTARRTGKAWNEKRASGTRGEWQELLVPLAENGWQLG